MPDGRQPGPGGWNRIHLIVDDIEAEVTRLRDAGATFRNDIVTGTGRQADPARGPFGQRRRAVPTGVSLTTPASEVVRLRTIALAMGAVGHHGLRWSAGAHLTLAAAVRRRSRPAERARLRGRGRCDEPAARPRLYSARDLLRLAAEGTARRSRRRAVLHRSRAADDPAAVGAVPRYGPAALGARRRCRRGRRGAGGRSERRGQVGAAELDSAWARTEPRESVG